MGSRISRKGLTSVFQYVRCLLSHFILIIDAPSACANGEVAPFMGHNAYDASQTQLYPTITNSPIQILTLESHPGRRLC